MTGLKRSSRKNAGESAATRKTPELPHPGNSSTLGTDGGRPTILMSRGAVTVCDSGVRTDLEGLGTWTEKAAEACGFTCNVRRGHAR